MEIIIIWEGCLLASFHTKKRVIEQIWLLYFNNILYGRGIISEKEKNKMALKIENRKVVADSHT